jgi:Na+/proline symporter
MGVATAMKISPTAAVIFLVLVAVTLYITYWAGKRNKSASSHLVASGTDLRAGRTASRSPATSSRRPPSSAPPAPSRSAGFNGFYLAVYIPIAYLLAMLLVAEPLRNLGQFTLGDVLATAVRGNNVRGAIATSSIVCCRSSTSSPSSSARRLLIQLLFGIPNTGSRRSLIGVLTLGLHAVRRHARDDLHPDRQDRDPAVLRRASSWCSC